MATFDKRKGKRGTTWQAKVRLLGQAASKTFPRLSDARDWAEQAEREIRSGRFDHLREAERHTVSDLLKRYRRGLEADAPEKLSVRRGHLDWWEKEFGTIRLHNLTPARIAEARDRLAQETTRLKKKRSAGHTNRHLATLSAALSMSVKEWGWLGEHPMIGKVSRKTEPQGRVRFLSENERKALLDACRDNDQPALYPIVVLALATGMRQGEILSMTWDAVDLQRGRITLEHTKNKDRRGVPLTGHALAVMENYSKVRRIDTRDVFPDMDGHLGPFRKAWDGAVRAAGLVDFRFHDLRHSAASELAMNGATPGEIAAVLGHKTLAMVKRYAHLSDTHVAGVVERMNEKIFKGAAK